MAEVSVTGVEGPVENENPSAKKPAADGLQPATAASNANQGQAPESSRGKS